MGDNSTFAGRKPARKTLLREWFEDAIRKQVITFIEHNELGVAEYAGHGGFATIMSARWRGEIVALKFLNTALRFDADDLDTFVKEVCHYSKCERDTNVNKNN